MGRAARAGFPGVIISRQTAPDSHLSGFSDIRSSSGYNVAISRLDPSRMGGPVRLSLDTREVGRVTIVRCNGRIVAGGESESLREHVIWLLRDRRSIVLDLSEVGFIDSSGLGTIVRTLTSTRQAR